MALSKEVAVDKRELLEDGTIQVRTVTRIMEDGIELSKAFHRHVLHPGSDLTGEDASVVRVAEAEWTPEVIQAYKDKQAAQEVL